MSHIVSLTQLPVGQRLRLVRVEGGLGLRRRLLSLGVHIGGEMKLVHRHGGRVVLARGNNRIALGEGISHCLYAEALD